MVIYFRLHENEINPKRKRKTLILFTDEIYDIRYGMALTILPYELKDISRGKTSVQCRRKPGVRHKTTRRQPHPIGIAHFKIFKPRKMLTFPDKNNDLLGLNMYNYRNI